MDTAIFKYPYVLKKDELIDMTDQNLPYDFWKQYYDADHLQKDKVLKPVIKQFKNLSVVDRNLDEYNSNFRIATFLKGYFDDLIEFMEIKDEGTNKKD